MQVVTSVPESDSVSALIRYRTWSPWGMTGCRASAQDDESAGFSDLSNVVTVNWRPEARNLSHVWKAVASWSLTRPKLAPQPMPAVPEPEGTTSLNNCTNHSLINHCRPTVTGARQPMRVEWYGTCSVPYHSTLRVGACSSGIKCGIWVTCVYRM